MGSISQRISTQTPLIFMMVRFPSLSFASTWVWTNEFGMLHVAMSQPSCTSITAVKSVPSVPMVRLVTSLHSIYVLHCVLPFAQCLDFIILSLFSVKNRSGSIALCLSDLLSEHLWTILKHDLLCSCFISMS